MSKENNSVSQTVNSSGIGLIGLIILFNNFNDDYDLYDLICNLLIHLAK